MTDKISMNKNRQSVSIREGGVGISGGGSGWGGGFDLRGGAVEVVESLGFLTALVVINARDDRGNQIAITLLPDDAERVAAAIASITGVIKGR